MYLIASTGGNKKNLRLIRQKNLKTINLVKSKLGMIRIWSLLLKLQKVHKENLACFHGNGTILSHFEVSLCFPKKASKKRNTKTLVLRKLRNHH